MDSLKNELSDKTFVGEYVGKSDLVQLIKYSREAIIFHAVVSNKRNASTAARDAYCMADGVALLKRYMLDVSPTAKVGTFSDYNEMCDALEEVHRDVSAQTMTQSEEGAVITFV